jgi:NADPH:quinone reductase-like Zn-dependent oxidoreductase
MNLELSAMSLDESLERLLGSSLRACEAQMLSLFVRQKLGTLIAIARKDDLQVLREFLEAGTVKPVVDRTFALSEVAEAIRYLREGRARGKVVVTV